MTPDTDPSKRILYGRRKGRRLRSSQRRLLAENLAGKALEFDQKIDDPARLFDPPVAKVWLEIGFGAGEHLAAQAQANPDIGLIGCEPFMNGVAQLLGKLERGRINNVRIVADDARPVIDALPEASIDRCFILFPDPWPKRRHNRRRIVSPETLRGIARILVDEGRLRLATDHTDYLRWMLFHTLDDTSFEWCARGPDDWRRRPPDWPQTRYEEKAAARNVKSTFLEFRRRPRHP